MNQPITPTLQTSVGTFALKERVKYPNGGRSLFYELGTTAVIVDYDICRTHEGEPAFDYSLITSKQNEYVARHDRVYRLLSEDIAELERFLHPAEDDDSRDPTRTRPADRADLAEASPLEHAFEEHFSNVYSADSARFLTREYAVTMSGGTGALTH